MERIICLLLSEHLSLRPDTAFLGFVHEPLDYVHLTMVAVQVLQLCRCQPCYSTLTTGTPHQWSGCPRPREAECWAGTVSLKKTAVHSQPGGNMLSTDR